MVDNFMTEWEQRERRPPLVLVDSYGNKWKGYMPAYFASAFWCVLFNGLCGRIGLLHLHMAECGSVLRKGLLLWLARLLRVPAVVHVHAAEFVDFYAALPRVLQRLVSVTLRCATRCIVLGTSYREYFINVVALDASRVEIVFNGVPDPDIQRTAPHQATCELLFAGAMNERKGLQDLLSALASDRLRHGSWHLAIAGNGDDTPFRKQSKMSGLADKVTFHGWMTPSKMHDLNFVYEMRLQAYLTAYDPQYERASPGTILMVHYIRWAFDSDFLYVDFLRGDEPFKYRFANALTPLNNYIGARTLVGRVLLLQHHWYSSFRDAWKRRFRPVGEDGGRDLTPADRLLQEQS